MANRKEAKAVLDGSRTTQDVESLLDAVEAAGADEAFDLIAGTDPIPSSMSDLRALRLRRICVALGRELMIEEIMAVFRIADSTARSVAVRMRATYPLQMRAIRQTRIEAMRAAAKVFHEKPADREERYRIRFSQPSALEFACQLLAEAGFPNSFEEAGKNLFLDLRAEQPGGGQVNLLTEVLELDEP